jgi:hypothetical protein
MNDKQSSTQAAHTSGPWEYEPKGSRFFIDGADGLTVAYIDRQGVRERAEIEANARLTAAAPQLLGALKSLMGATDYFAKDRDTQVALNEARSAIARAEGRAE